MLLQLITKRDRFGNKESNEKVLRRIREGKTLLRVIAVSYTHLDVYKRQNINGTATLIT